MVRSILLKYIRYLPDKAIMCDFIIGRSLFQTITELKISHGVIEINKICPEVLQVMAIEVDTNELDIGFKEYSSVIRNMVDSYIPHATETTPMKTKIIVSDDQPVFNAQDTQHPKRGKL